MDLEKYNAELRAIINKMDQTSMRFVQSFNSKAERNKRERQHREAVMVKYIEAGVNDVDVLCSVLNVSHITLTRYALDKHYIVVSGKVVRE